jgi:2-keto-4-pentenoate hydratase/2-oxohepta-3-ene-1,7-dioic acid hydratase in catechol pathway
MSRRRFVKQSAGAGLAVAAAASAVAQDSKSAGRVGSMRLCRYEYNNRPRVAFYFDDGIVDLFRVPSPAGSAVNVPATTNLLDLLGPDGKGAKAVAAVWDRLGKASADQLAEIKAPLSSVKLLVPIPDPKKVILLAGNYSEHVKESGGVTAERKETFPYFFWKPPSTTLTNPGDPIRIPKVSPNSIDWEIELGVVIGRRCRDVSEKDALSVVAGYSVCNDVSDRKFQINPGRKLRERDKWHDWLHGKWHDTFLPMGPCVAAASPVVDPQKYKMSLKVNGAQMQNASTAQMVFSVAALVSILSTFMTLEPGDIISTGTPAGVGAAMKPPVFLKAGDTVEAEIEGIGMLRNPVTAG